MYFVRSSINCLDDGIALDNYGGLRVYTKTGWHWVNKMSAQFDIYDTETKRVYPTGAIYIGKNMFYKGVILYYLPFVDFLLNSLVVPDDTLYEALQGRLKDRDDWIFRFDTDKNKFWSRYTKFFILYGANYVKILNRK